MFHSSLCGDEIHCFSTCSDFPQDGHLALWGSLGAAWVTPGISLGSLGRPFGSLWNPFVASWIRFWKVALLVLVITLRKQNELLLTCSDFPLDGPLAVWCFWGTPWVTAGVSLGGLGRPLGSAWGPFVASWHLFGLLWGPSRVSCGPSGSPLVVLGISWESFWCRLGSLENFLSSFWVSWAALGASWAPTHGRNFFYGERVIRQTVFSHATRNEMHTVASYIHTCN